MKTIAYASYCQQGDQNRYFICASTLLGLQA